MVGGMLASLCMNTLVSSLDTSEVHFLLSLVGFHFKLSIVGVHLCYVCLGQGHTSLLGKIIMHT